MNFVRTTTDACQHGPAQQVSAQRPGLQPAPSFHSERLSSCCSLAPWRRTWTRRWCTAQTRTPRRRSGSSRVDVSTWRTATVVSSLRPRPTSPLRVTTSSPENPATSQVKVFSLHHCGYQLLWIQKYRSPVTLKFFQPRSPRWTHIKNWGTNVLQYLLS